METEDITRWGSQEDVHETPEKDAEALERGIW